MMEIKIDESKILEFNTIIEGGKADDLSGTIRILIDNVEYGFPISLDDKKIKAKIPPLKDYVKEENFKNVEKVSARLDIVAKGKLFTPWKENVNLEIPLEVKAEMTDIKGFLDEANITLSKVNEISETVKIEEENVDEDKKKSRFTIMLEKK